MHATPSPRRVPARLSPSWAVRAARLLLAAFAAAAALGGGPARAEGVVHVVRTTADSVTAPPAGSLREAVETLAGPGDVIRFDGPIEVQLEANLVIRPALAGLRIEGRGGIRAIAPKGRVPKRLGDPIGRIVVLAADVTLDGLAFANHFVDVAGNFNSVEQVPVRGVQVVDCTFSGNGGVNLDRVTDGVVSGCTFDVTNLRAFSAVIDLDRTEGCRIEGNTVAALPDPAAFAISDVESEGLLVDRNTCGAPLFLQSRSGTVRKTTMPGAQLYVVAPPSGAAGHVDVLDNEAARLTVARSGADVEGNTVVEVPSSARDPKGLRVPAFGPTLLRVAPGGAGMAAAPVNVRFNRVEGGDIGIGYSDVGGRGTGSVLEGNEVVGARRSGISVGSDGDVALVSNTVTGIGGGKVRNALGIDVRSGAGGVLVSGGTVDGVVGFGVSVSGKGPLVEILGTTARRSRRAGFVVERRLADLVGVTAEENENDGIACDRGSNVRIDGATVRANRLSGVRVAAGASAEIRRIASSGNLGPGIDVDPAGVTPNAKRLRANRDIPWPDDLAYDAAKRRVTGRSVPGATIDVYAVEDGARQGNLKNGEGARFLGTAVADASGAFAWDASECPANGLLTFTATATLGGGSPVTSEFSEDLGCEGGATVDLVSRSSAGDPGDADSELGTFTAAFPVAGLPCVSAGGRHVAFVSRASNLTADAHDPDDVHVYLADRTAGTTVRVTKTYDGGPYEPDFHEYGQVAGNTASVSDDGRFVAFVAWSARVVPGEGWPLGDGPTVVLYDAESATNVAVTDPTYFDSPLPSGEFSHLGGWDCAISGDGSAVVFASAGRDWTGAEADLDEDVFVWTRATGAFERVSVTSGGAEAPGSFSPVPLSPRLSHDARFVVFASPQALTPPNDTPGTKVFLRDRSAGTTEIVSVDTAGLARRGSWPSVSDDGRFVAFATDEAIDPADTNGTDDVYLRDRQTGTTTRVSLRGDGTQFATWASTPSLSGDGRFVAFVLNGSFQRPGGVTMLGIPEIHVVDRTAGTIGELAGPSGEAFGRAFAPAWSRDGTALAFVSDAPNLLATPPGWTEDQVWVARSPSARTE